MHSSLAKATLAAVITAVLWGIAVRTDLLRHLPGFACEGFGCMGSGILIGAVQLLVLPCLLAILGAVLGRGHRIGNALLFGSMTFLAMLMLLCVFIALNRADIAASERAAAETCKQYPKLCPNGVPTPGVGGH